MVSAWFAMKVLNQKPKDVKVFGYAFGRDDDWKKVLMNYFVNDKYVPMKDEVCFTDLSFNDGELDWARNKEKTSKWIWVDHHYSSVKFPADEIFDEVRKDPSEDVCAGDLAFDWFSEFNEVEDVHIEWRDAAHDRDLWINSNRELGMKMEMVIKGVIWERNHEAFIRNMDKGIDWILNKYDDLCKRGLRKYDKSCQLANNTMFVDNYKSFKVIVSYVDGSPSDVADTLYTSNNDIIALINMYTPNMILNLRARRDDVDLSKIAKECFSGGGHKKAAGGKLNKYQLAGGSSGIADTIVDGLTSQWR